MINTISMRRSVIVVGTLVRKAMGVGGKAAQIIDAGECKINFL
jgi:hypothetical protein